MKSSGIFFVLRQNEKVLERAMSLKGRQARAVSRNVLLS